MKNLLSKSLVERLNASTREAVAGLIDSGTEPHLAVILVGEDPSSLKYISIKSRVAKDVGIIVSLYYLEADTPIQEIEQAIDHLNADEEVHGIIIQLPLPDSFSNEQVDSLLKRIKAEKDVDGLRGDWKELPSLGTNVESLLQPQAFSVPPMVSSILSLLDHHKVSLEGKKVVIVGRGRLVGQPMEEFLTKAGLDVRAVDEETPDILDITKSADILIAAAGEDNLVTYQWVKEGAVVIDCAADVHLDSVEQLASAIAPPVGGVGPLTVCWLLHNTAQAAAYGGRHG